MSMTLEALWSIHGLTEQADAAQATELLARRRRRGFSLSFFFGPMWFVLVAVLLGWYYQFRKKSPEKAKGFEQRVRGASASAASRVKSAVDDRTARAARPPQQRGGDFPTAQREGLRFNSPPNWPTPPAGWTPDADWRPNPSWPPAPDGWQFWVD